MYKCEKCNKEYKQLKSHDNHMKNCLGLKKFICNICNKEFKGGKALYGHKMMSHGNKKLESKNKEHICKICNENFTTAGALGGHMTTTHGSVNCKREFKCDICGKTIYTNKGSFQMHVNLHNKIFADKIKQKISNTKKEFFNDPEKCKDYLQQLSQRMTGFKHSDKTKNQISNSVKNYIKNLSQDEYGKFILNYINAPKKGNGVNHSGKYTPTKIEQIIIDLNINGLIYNGNGKNAIAIRFENKNFRTTSVPDFLYKGTNKLIEVFGKYWHPKEDEELYLNACNENNYELLILWEEELYNDFESCKNRIYQFLNIKEEDYN